MFMAYPGVFYVDDGQIFRAMQRAGEIGALICMHAENGIAIDVLVQQALAEGHTAPIYHALTRPPSAEAEATHRADRLAEMAGAPVYIVHLSRQRGAREGGRGARPRPAGVRRDLPAVPVPVAATNYEEPGFEGAKYVCARRCAQGSTRRRCGAGCAPTTCRWSPPTTARSA